MTNTPVSEPASPAAPTPATAQASATPSAGKKAPAVPLPAPKSHTTRHTIEIDGRDWAYETTVGTLHIDSAKVSPASSVFYSDAVALPDGEHPDTSRPVTFIFNGGPGSASTYLLLGSVGPRRIRTPDAQPIPAAPYELIDNPQTLLPATDLVFIDAPGAGFSDIAEEAKAELWSVDGDVAGFVAFIRRYLTAKHRWNSPKFILGESYGTTRGAALTLALLESGIAVQGLVLVSSILDYGAHIGLNDQGYVGFFPTYAAIAHWHHRAGTDVTLSEHVQRAREFADGRLRQALATGDRLPAQERRAVAEGFAALTGLSPEYVERSDLRVTDERFRKELLRDEQRVVGRYDGRVAGYDLDQAAEAETFVVDDSFVDPAYSSLVNAYLRDELGWDGSEERRGFADIDYDSIEPGKGWGWSHKLPGGAKSLWGSVSPYPLVVPDLAAALVRHPLLKVLAVNGYFDLATPFFLTEHDIAHLGVPAPLRSNVAFTYYEAGHMVYTSERCLEKLAADLFRFYDATLAELPAIDERVR